ncbi:hypothetical protein [Sorangium sp. So ce542]|uniref:hypothetical protein n=1 Tax=Sorangium sp. So ce542 TaxID=3133316 RepID=UPI003F637BF0
MRAWIRKVASRLKSMPRALADYGPISVSFVCPLAIGILTAYMGFDEKRIESLRTSTSGRISIAAVVALFFLGCAGFVVDVRKKATARQQVRDMTERMRRSYASLVRSQLQLLANAFGFSENERVSVYRKVNNTFLLLARYSRNPTYDDPGRAVYPINQGVIWAAWSAGTASVRDLPNPEKDLSTYVSAHTTRWQIPEEVVSGFKMKSRCYTAFGINDTRDMNRIAVIVFESTSSAGLKSETIVRQLESGEARRIASMLEELKNFEPTPEYAQKEGF